MPKYTNKIWTKEEDKFMHSNYRNFEGSAKEFAQLMGRTVDSVQSRASFLKIKKIKTLNRNNKYSLNREYFDVIDSHEKAYWYGFLWADGSIYKNVFELALQKQDLHLIESFKKAIESTHLIKKHYRYETYRFCISSKKFILSLSNLNIGERKSYSTLSPVISDKFFFSFLLGLFDGDGNVQLGGMRFTTSPVIADWITKKIYSLTGIVMKTRLIPDVHAVRLDLHRQRDSLIIYSKMYSESPIFLHRKLNKILSFYSSRTIDNPDLRLLLSKKMG